MVKIASANLWVPDRQDIIWIDCNPQAGQEMCDIDPLLVLFPRIFNDKTSLSICLPMTTPNTMLIILLRRPQAKPLNVR